jgi:hypothetical protein
MLAVIALKIVGPVGRQAEGEVIIAPELERENSWAFHWDLSRAEAFLLTTVGELEGNSD